MTITITLQQAADFASIAYQPLGTPLPITYKNEGWVSITPTDHDYGNNGYFGVAFVKLVQGNPTELVIAHRGTEPTDIGDLRSDIQLSLGKAAQQLGDVRH